MNRTKQSVQRELKQQYTNLDIIEEKIAKYTELEAPVHLITRRDETRQHIAELEEMLHSGELLDEAIAGNEDVPRGQLHNVPELPPHFLPRPDDLQAIKVAILTIDKPVAITGATRKVGLQGMGGIGKSVLAAVLARDEEVRRAFPDGVFWLTLGQEPALTTRQSQLAEALGDPIRIFGDAQQGRARLSELLVERVCLLILDDVWQVAHTEAFNALGSGGRLLLTSRDAGIIRSLGAAEHRLEILKKSEALELLAQWAGQAVEDLPAEARLVAQECGYLPLALAMIGAQVKGNSDRWGNVLHKLQQADLAKIRQQFPHYPYPNLLRALHVSVEALEPDAQARYLELAVFPEDTPIPEAALQTFWTAAGLDAYDVQDLVDTLVDRSLARRDDQDRLSLHDLQYDYVHKQAGDLTVLHQRLIGAYRQQCPNGWGSGPNDGYYFEHLAYHLAGAGQRENLYALISKEWMDAQFKRTYSHRAFADDVERAIEIAGAEEPPNLVQVIRGCLVYATLGELATNVPPEILGVLAQVGQVERALGYASQIQSVGTKSEAYWLIGQSLYKQNDIHKAKSALEQALVEAEAIENGKEGVKASILAKVAGTLAEAEIAGKLDELGERRQAVSVAEQVLVMVEGIKHVVEKVEALSGVVVALTKSGEQERAVKVADKAMQVAERIENLWEKLQVLQMISAALAQAGEGERAIETADLAVQLAEEIIEAIKTEEEKAYGLNWVATMLVEVRQYRRAVEMADRALHAVERIKSNQKKVEILSVIATILTQAGEKKRATKVADWAMQVAKEIEHTQEKFDAFGVVVAALAEMGEFDRALQMVEGIEFRGKARTLSKIAKELAQVGEQERAVEVAEWVLQIAERIEKYSLMKVQVLQWMVRRLDLVGKFDYSLVEGIEDEGVKKMVLSVIAELPEAREYRLATEATNQEEKEKAPDLSMVTKLIEEGEFDRALLMAKGIKDIQEKRRILNILVAALAKTKQPIEVIDQIRQMAAVVLAEMGKFGSALQMVDEIYYKSTKIVAVRAVTVVLAEAGQSNKVRQIWRDAIIMARLYRRDELFETLLNSVPALAALDQGETLWQVYEAVMEVEGWWSKEGMKVEG